MSIRSDLKIYNVNHKIIDYQNEWKEHVERMGRDRLPKIQLEYEPGRYQNRWQPLCRWFDQSSRN